MNQKTNLFAVDFERMKDSPKHLAISTPLGEVILGVVVNGEKFFKVLTSGKLKSGLGQVCILDSTACYLEVLTISISPKVPDMMSVDGCVAFLVRFKAKKQIDIKFICELPFGSDIREIEPESGEGFIAQTFSNKNFQVSLGTEDGEFLSSRAEHGEWLPQRYFSEGLIDDNIASYLKDGVQVALSNLRAGEIGQVQFIVSWSQIAASNLSATWFAVGLASRDVLQLGGLV